MASQKKITELYKKSKTNVQLKKRKRSQEDLQTSTKLLRSEDGQAVPALVNQAPVQLVSTTKPKADNKEGTVTNCSSNKTLTTKTSVLSKSLAQKIAATESLANKISASKSSATKVATTKASVSKSLATCTLTSSHASLASKIAAVTKTSSKIAAVTKTSAKIAAVTKTSTKTAVTEQPSTSTKVETSTTSSSEPAYKRFAALAKSAILPIPVKFKELNEKFKSMDQISSMLFNRGEIIKFTKLQSAVQTMVKKAFTHINVGQIRTVMPEGYKYFLENKELVLEPNLSAVPSSSKVTHNESGRPVFSSTLLIERRQFFLQSLVDIVMTEHRKFLLTGLERPLEIDEKKLTKWHPEFKLENVPNIVPAELPQPPNAKKFLSAKQVLEQANPSLNQRVQKALKSVADKTATTSAATSSCAPKPTDNKLAGINAALIERIRAKAAIKQELNMTRSPEQGVLRERLGRLPETVRIIRSFFLIQRRPAQPFGDVVRKLVDSFKSPLSPGEAEKDLELLLSLTPEYVQTVQVSRGKYVKINNSIELKDIFQKIATESKKYE